MVAKKYLERDMEDSCSMKENGFAENSDLHCWKRQFCSSAEAWHQNDLSNLSYLVEN